MSSLTLTSVRDLGDDRLEAVATDDAGNEYRATGWVSATTNHFDPHAYGDDGHLDPKAEPRQMTAAEVGEYALSLILEQHPELTPPAVQATAELAFEAPATVELTDPAWPAAPL
jgi:hypothetical protein